MIIDVNQWAEFTFGLCKIGDKRRTNRLVQIAKNLATNVGSSLAKSSPDLANVEGSYRFMRNKQVSADAIAKSGFESTVKLATDYNELLALEDTTSLNYKHSVTNELGHASNSLSNSTKGMFAHSVLLYSPEQSHVVGLIEQRRWVRDEATFGDSHHNGKRAYHTKESYKWEQASEAMQSRLKEQMAKCISVCDREADIIEYMSYKQSNNQRFIVRAKSNRPLKGGGKLYDHANELESAGEYTVNVQQRGGRHAREAIMGIRYAPVKVLAPKRKQSLYPALNTYVVYCEEIAQSEDIQPLKWCLLTTEPITSKEQALKIVRYYELRWKVELFHKVWKTEGTDVERLRMQERDNIERMAVIQAFVATRLMQLKEIGDSEEAKKLPCTLCLSDIQWKLLFKVTHKKKKIPTEPPTMQWAYHSLGKLAGWKNSKRTGRISWKTLWEGWSKLDILIEGYEIMRAEM